MEYCDLIAQLIVDGIKTQENKLPVNFFGIRRKLDIHPEHGYMLSTDKFITCRDNKGNKYKITVQANPAASLEEKIQRANRQHSRNGDPISFHLDSLSFKLGVLAQDRTILAEITDEEIDILRMEVESARSAKEVSNGSF